MMLVQHSKTGNQVVYWPDAITVDSVVCGQKDYEKPWFWKTRAVEDGSYELVVTAFLVKFLHGKDMCTGRIVNRTYMHVVYQTKMKHTRRKKRVDHWR
mmetsp:Transcript_44438/g.60693  ORF Transcript_44438/g.60693 Transcript_44438/m.60693 type:complete len:98 (+) Transcript_44438:4045-4338(+)